MFSQPVLVAFENGESVVYGQASGWNQVYLWWTFRNFRSLPQNVLSPRQQQLMATLYRDASRQIPRELSDAFVMGTVEDFNPSRIPSLSTSRKDRTPAASPPRKPSADVAVLDRGQRLRTPFALGRMTLKIGAAALVAIIAILAWHQLGAEPLSRPAAFDSKSPLAKDGAALYSEVGTIAKELPSTAVEPHVQSVAAPPVPVTAAKTAPESPSPAESTLSLRVLPKPAAKIPAANPRPNQLVAKAPAAKAPAANDRAGHPHRAVVAPPSLYEASAEPPRIQISGRPRRLVYPVCPETHARGKVSLQAVVEYDGAVSRVRVLTGDRVLAKAAVEAVRQWRYEPFFGATPHVERETSITVSFISNEVVAVSFPESTPFSR